MEEKARAPVVPTSESLQDKDACNTVKREGGENSILVDRISALPDEILSSILSLLSLNEAAATSILSRRWQYLWASTTNLNFDADDTLLGYFSQLKPDFRRRESTRYVDWVNSVVEQHTGPYIKQFRACFDLDRRFSSSVDKWIEFALEKRVQVLMLDFLIINALPCVNSYTFPHKLLEGGCVGFQSLKVLHLENVDLPGQGLDYFLANCLVLERLSVSNVTNLVNLRVVGPSVGLKYLRILLCPYLLCITICDTNLVSFVYDGWVIDLFLRNLPLLVEVSISGWDDYSPIQEIPSTAIDETDFIMLAFSQLSCCLSQLEALMMDIRGMDWNENYVLPILPKLKHLELIVSADDPRSLSKLTCFLKASPYLQRLVLKLEFFKGEEEKLEEAAKCPHHNLKVIEIVGYRGRINAVEHITYLIANAIALEKIVVDPIQRWAYHYTGAGKSLDVMRNEREARNHVMHQLKEKVPSTIEFVCLDNWETLEKAVFKLVDRV